MAEIEKLTTAWNTAETGYTNAIAERDEAWKRIAELEAEIEKLRNDLAIERSQNYYLDKCVNSWEEHVEEVEQERDELKAKFDTVSALMLKAENQRDEARRVARRLYRDNELKDGDIIRLCEELDAANADIETIDVFHDFAKSKETILVTIFPGNVDPTTAPNKQSDNRPGMESE